MKTKDEIRLMRQELRDGKKFLTNKMVEITPEAWPEKMRANSGERSIFRSKEFLAQLFLYTGENGVIARLTINRTEIDNRGMWKDNISWDDLQRIKSECGYGDYDAVEIYPPDHDVVNVANMRHLWIVSTFIPYAWRNK